MFCFLQMGKGRGLNLLLKLGIHIAVKCNCSYRKLALNTSMGGIFLVDYLPAHLYLLVIYLDNTCEGNKAP